ncbi:MAG: leucyl aminopeptidase [Acidimicrobiia bacterium]
MTSFVTGPSPLLTEGDALAVPVFGDLTWGPGAEEVAAALGGWVPGYLESREFSGKTGQIAVLPGAGSVPYAQVVFVGLGEEADVETLRRAAADLGRSVRKHDTVVTTLHELDLDGAAEAIAFGFLLGQYRFDRYLSEPDPGATGTVVFAGADDEAVAAGAHRGTIVADAVAYARDLVNEPAGDQPPARLAEAVAEMAADRGIEVTVYNETRMEEERFGGVLAVAAGAVNPPRLVVLEYAPDDPVATLALVGKGIVFDSGGLSLKTATGMEAMKTDMSGAAAVFATLRAIAELEMPVRVLGIAPLAENMPGGAAQRPGDVMRARNGKTIEVLNTDAEGRLVLADGLSLAVEAEPDLIVDIATLTGACAVALGPKIGGLFSNDDDAAEQVRAAAARAGEKLWHMPLETEYRKHIESAIADMKNTGERYGSAISAALILSEFAGDGPWVHLDIAGPARASKAEYYLSKGGSGFGVRTLVALVEDLAG